MRLLRVLAASACLAVLSACGGSSPASPDANTASIVPTGAQVFRIALSSACPDPSRTLLPMLYSGVMLARVGTEWVANASSPASGDVELRFHQSSSRTVANSFEIAGTIKGTAVHVPELFPTLTWDARANFGTDARTTLTGVAFGAGFIGAQTGGVDGVGSGSVVLSDTSGHSCTGSSFSWSVYPVSK